MKYITEWFLPYWKIHLPRQAQWILTMYVPWVKYGYLPDKTMDEKGGKYLYFYQLSILPRGLMPEVGTRKLK